jgi:polar amino acid transport system ATP-binding protein/sulfate transport system ATP-binding protein
MSNGETIVLSATDISQRLGGNLILDKLSFKVRDRVRPGVTTGQVVGLLGPSGVGKTRLLRLIAGLDAPDTGFIRGPSDQPMPAGSVGVVFQNYILLRHRTVLGNLVTAGVTNGLSRTDSLARARDLLQIFGLSERASFYPSQLSGGQRQRVAIAQQLVKQKLVLVMDEPFSGLDPVALDAVVDLISRVAHVHEHTTIVVITHDIRAAILVADTLLLLGRDRDPGGRIVPGAHIQHEVDLVAEGLAWRKDVELDPKFVEMERDVKARFARL